MTLTYDSDPDEVADVLIAECIRRGYPREACIAVDSTGRQESGLQMVWSRNRLWFGYFQQDSGYPNRMDPMGNMTGFLDRLDRQLDKPGASPDIWKNIFWLQQGPNYPSADHAFNVGRQAYLTEIQRHRATATMDYDRVAGAPQPGGTQVGWRGDPVWLPDVLRAEGLRCDIFPGAFERGHGDMGDIWGVVAHHTGSFGETPNGIANHPSLGLASQLYLSRDGVYTLCGVGIAWHAGNGSWPGLGTNNANPRTIGIEAANDGGGTPGKPHRASWSDAQYDAYVRGCAAIMRKLGYDSSHVIGHKDWAGPAQGKWDPGAIDMNIFRADIQRVIFRQAPGKQTDPVLEMLDMPDNATMLREIHDKLLAYPAVPEIAGKWPSRARCRRNNGGVDDTVGMELFIDANVYDLLVAWSAVTVGDPSSVATIRDGAAGKLPANDKDSIAWFKAVEAKIAKTTV